MRKKQRFAFLAIGGLGLLAAIAPGLAAGIQTPSGSDVPAAGQGDVEVVGYVVSDISWTFVENAIKIATVSFEITRGDGAVKVKADNTTVRARLEASGSDTTDWQECVVSGDDAATCTFPSSNTMDAGDVERVNIIAFDK